MCFVLFVCVCAAPRLEVDAGAVAVLPVVSQGVGVGIVLAQVSIMPITTAIRSTQLIQSTRSIE